MRMHRGRDERAIRASGVSWSLARPPGPKAQLEGEVEEGSGHPRVAQAAEALAVLGTYARLQEERWHFEVPPNVVHAIVFLLRTGRRHGGAPSPPRPLMLQVLHVVRNVSANHAEAPSERPDREGPSLRLNQSYRF